MAIRHLQSAVVRWPNLMNESGNDYRANEGTNTALRGVQCRNPPIPMQKSPNRYNITKLELKRVWVVCISSLIRNSGAALAIGLRDEADLND